ncbi:unnamed protein product [Dibothriocephalus latus]|uniref:Uncharacterized protein n=1 Tax=Dibothriocephalus latus TaxID=60516 RepID=A0A3P7LWJ3_DIBLA|nr:unnamed protein product [Dibothriocephalus latus]
MTRAFHSELVASSRCSAHAQNRMKYFLVMLYWIQGWTTFFQAGNSNKFNTIDLAAGYVGFYGHSNIFFLLLTASYTLGLLTASTTVSATVCFILHSHLFIWSVFAPKLFYMAVLNIVFIPFLVLIDIF